MEVEGEPDLVDLQLEDTASLEDGGMLEVRVGSGKQDTILVSKYNEKLYATGQYCSNCNSSLSKGVLFDDKVLCPNCAAGFSVVNGSVELAPGRDGIPKYEIYEKDDKQFVRFHK